MRRSLLALACLSLNTPAAFALDHTLPLDFLNQPAGKERPKGDRNHEVIYGEDDRHEVYDVEDAYRQAAASTVALINTALLKQKGKFLKLPASPTGVDRQWCSSERFYEQPSPAFCSGFLVAKDLIVTAGHCVEGEPGQSCDEIAFVFGFDMESAQSPRLDIPAEDIVQCKQIVGKQLDPDSKMDFALLRIDPVEGRKPLKLRRDGAIGDGESVTVIGHPSGLPTKVTKAGKVRGNQNPVFFTTDLDTYGGNSGSAVFNTESILAGDPVVEGILVRGALDFVQGKRKWDKAAGCLVSNRCGDIGGAACRGEEVTRIGAISQQISELGGSDDANAPPPSPQEPDEDGVSGTDREGDPALQNILDGIKAQSR
ncbi:MAG: serine protease [Gammaproteobacteria bacterium]|nr:serine protease [Gammaproteobacteria bacterium]MBU1656187.1 serine protease [Gammaproteobacteria bacterium]MBU1960447.1 serine protease [Gammaproteobacteria bacterium]